jgi:hypothetical protein
MNPAKMSKFSIFLMLLFFIVFALLAKNAWEYFTRGTREGFALSTVQDTKIKMLQYSNNNKMVYTLVENEGDNKLFFDPENGVVFSHKKSTNTLHIYEREYGTKTTSTDIGEYGLGTGSSFSETPMISLYNSGWIKEFGSTPTQKFFIAYVPFGRNTLIHIFSNERHIRTRYFDSDGNIFSSSDPTNNIMVGVGQSISPQKTISLTNTDSSKTKMFPLTGLTLAAGDFLGRTAYSPIPQTAIFSLELSGNSLNVSAQENWTSVSFKTEESAVGNITIPAKQEGFKQKEKQKEGLETATTVTLPDYPNQLFKAARDVYVDPMNSYLVSDSSSTVKVYDNEGTELPLPVGPLTKVTRTKTNTWAVNGIMKDINFFVVYMDNGRKTMVVKILKETGNFTIDSILRIEDGAIKSSDETFTNGTDKNNNNNDYIFPNTSGPNGPSDSFTKSSCNAESLELKMSGFTLCVPTAQLMSYATTFLGGGLSPGDNFIRKTEMVPSVCPQCPLCPSGNICTNCGGHGGSGTIGTGKDGDKTSLLRDTGSGVSSLLRDTGSGASSLLRDGAGGTDSLLRDTASGTINTATNATVGAVGLAKDTVGGAAGFAKETAGGAVGIGRELLGSTVGIAQGAATGIGGGVYDAANGISSGISGAASGVYGAATSIGGGLGSIGAGIGNLATQTNPAMGNGVGGYGGGGGVNPSYGYGYPGGGYGSNQSAYQNSTGQQAPQVPGIDPYSYYGALSQRPSNNFMPRTADFSTFGK